MAIHKRFTGNTVVLSGIARLMNDPKHFDASRDVSEILDQGIRRLVIDVGGVRETGATILGLLTTLTRLVRKSGGELVLANPSPQLESFLDEMRMDSYWDLFDDVETAVGFLESWERKPKTSDS